MFRASSTCVGWRPWPSERCCGCFSAELKRSSRSGETIWTLMPPGVNEPPGHHQGDATPAPQPRAPLVPQAPAGAVDTRLRAPRRDPADAGYGDRRGWERGHVVIGLIPKVSNKLQAVHARHSQFAEEHVAVSPFEDSQRFSSGRGCADVRAIPFEDRRHQGARVVIARPREQTPSAVRPVPRADRLGDTGRCASGSVTVTVVPLPGPSLAAVIVPPCCSTRWRHMDRPSPRPRRENDTVSESCSNG